MMVMMGAFLKEKPLALNPALAPSVFTISLTNVTLPHIDLGPNFRFIVKLEASLPTVTKWAVNVWFHLRAMM